MRKGGCVRVIEGEEVRKDDPIEYFIPAGIGNTSWVPEEVMVIEVPRRKRFLEGRTVGEKESILPSVGEQQIAGGKHIKKRERGGVVKKDVDPT